MSACLRYKHQTAVYNLDEDAWNWVNEDALFWVHFLIYVDKNGGCLKNNGINKHRGTFEEPVLELSVTLERGDDVSDSKNPEGNAFAFDIDIPRWPNVMTLASWG